MTVADWTSRERRRTGRALWFGVLAGPLAWLAHLAASYVLASLTCLRGWPGVTILGLSGGQVIMTVFTLVVLALIAAAGGLAYQHWRRLRAQPGGGGNGFEHWLAFSGVLVSGMFFVAVVFAGLPAIVLQPCR